MHSLTPPHAPVHKIFEANAMLDAGSGHPAPLKQDGRLLRPKKAATEADNGFLPAG
jgi:hypothetical protein